MTVVIEEEGSAKIAGRVVESSRELYARQVEKDASPTILSPQSQAQVERKRRKNHATTTVSDDLKSAKSVA